MKYSYSTDEEHFTGQFDSAEEAATVGFSETEENTLFVGESVRPTPPEDHNFVDLIIEHVQCQDEYQGDWAENWPDATDAQKEEFEADIRRVFAAWLDKHSLRPAFWTVANVKEYKRDLFA